MSSLPRIIDRWGEYLSQVLSEELGPVVLPCSHLSREDVRFCSIVKIASQISDETNGRAATSLPEDVLPTMPSQGVSVFCDGGARPPVEVMFGLIDDHRVEHEVETICPRCGRRTDGGP